MKTKKESSTTVVSMAFFSLILYFVFKAGIFIYLSFAALLIALFFPRLTEILSFLWLGLLGFIGSVNTRIVIFLVFYLVLVPTAFLFRLFKRGSFSMKEAKARPTHWHERNHLFAKKDLENVW